MLLLRSIIDALVQGEVVAADLGWQIAGMLALGMVGVWAAYVAVVLSAKAARAAVADMQSAMFRRLTTMPIHFYTTVRPGAIVARLTGDASGAEAMYTSVIPVVVSSVTTIVTTVAIVAFVDPRLILLLVVIPAAIFYVRKAESRINEMITRSFDVTKELASTAETFVSRDGAILSRQNGRTAREQGKFEEKTRVLAGLSAATKRAAATSSAAYGTAFAAITAGALAMAVWLVTEQNVTVGTVILVVLYLQQLQGPVQSLLGARYPRMRAGIALDRVEAVLATNPGNPAPTDSAATDPYTGSPSAPALWIAGVRYRYPAVSSYSIEGLSHAGDALSIAWLPMTGLSGDDRPADDAGRSGPAGGNALDDLDLSIGRGEFVAVVGPSGAGKSTLAGIASGLVEPDEGVVQVGDFTVAHLDETRRATLVAYIPQEPYVLHASVRDNLRYARPDATTPR